MAKSIRSKWRRKCRAVKRERYGKKELDRLKKTLGIEDDDKVTDEAMTEVSEVATVIDAKTIKERQEATQSDQQNEGEVMDTDAKKRVYNSRTMKDQHGTYPVWMHQRKIKKSKTLKKKIMKNKAKSKKKN